MIYQAIKRFEKDGLGYLEVRVCHMSWIERVWYRIFGWEVKPVYSAEGK